MYPSRVYINQIQNIGLKVKYSLRHHLHGAGILFEKANAAPNIFDFANQDNENNNHNKEKARTIYSVDGY